MVNYNTEIEPIRVKFRIGSEVLADNVKKKEYVKSGSSDLIYYVNEVKPSGIVLNYYDIDNNRVSDFALVMPVPEFDIWKFRKVIINN